MYPISNEALALFHDRDTHHVQMAEITCETVNDTIVITDEDIRSGGLSINRYCSVGGSIGIGSAVAAELTLSLDNSDGKFNGVIFEGADMHVVIKIRDVTVVGSPIYSIPMGYFTVDEAPRMLETINLVALDRMVLLDKAVDKDLLVFPSSLENLLHQVCGICNLSTDVSFSSQPNGSYMVTVAPESDDLTYRQIVSWIAELTGRCAYINHDGRLQFEFYDTGQLQPVTEIGLADRFSSDLAENAITISGVQIVSDEDNKYLAGNEEYAFSIEGNELIRNGEQSVADALFAKLGGFTYTPFSAVIHSSPHLYPTDPVVFIDKDGNEHFSLITEVTFALNRNTSIESVGESALRKGWAATNPLTKRESSIIRSAFAEQNKRLDNRTQAIIALNELISNSAGLHNTSIEQEDGSFLHYMHDNPYLEDSMTIYTQTASGYAWTNNGWNDGAPVWQYGFDQHGNMVMRLLSTVGINADWINSGQINTNLITLGNKTLEEALDDAENEAKGYADTQLGTFATAVNGTLDELQNQIDGSITSWFYDIPPTTSNVPASSWTTTELKNMHLGDLYYDTSTGYAYRWQIVAGVHSWKRVADSDVTKALEDASKAQDTADSKRRVFTTTPTPPYDVGDLWAQGATGDLMRCKTTALTGAYVASHWEKASKYTDDARAVAAENNAKAHAETKADEARVAAEAVAEAQANLAKIEAEAYADGIVDDEEQARINQAAQNLAAAKTHANNKAAAAEAAAKGYADAQLYNFATAVDGDISDLQNQIDGKITTWFYAAVPTTANAPASTWTTTAMKDAHLGDLYYNTSTGQAYRWKKVSTTYSWEPITDTRIITALANASTAKDVADSKRRVFGSTPTPPYDVNDLWVQGTSGDIMRCITASTTTYSAAHWVKASKYTDDTTANENRVALTTISNEVIHMTSDIHSLDADVTTIKAGQAEFVKFSDIDGTKSTTIIDGGIIKTGTITANKIAADAITADKLNVTKLSSITSSLGDIAGGSINIGSGKFKVTTSGNLTATGADISGKITATSGEIGGFTIGSSTMVASNSGSWVRISGASGYYPIMVGTSTSDINFRVGTDGSLLAKSVTVTGTVNANYGGIGPLTVSSSGLTYNGRTQVTSGGYFRGSGAGVSGTFSGDMNTGRLHVSGVPTSASGSGSSFTVNVAGTNYKVVRMLFKTPGTDQYGLGLVAIGGTTPPSPPGPGNRTYEPY